MAKREKKSKKIAEFGDFQTPPVLASECCALLKSLGVNPCSIVEPTCGVGNFLAAALECFPDFEEAVGVEINSGYVAQASQKLDGLPMSGRIVLKCGSFFTTPWTELLQSLPAPILLIGNPPWVTNAELGTLGSENLPIKKNFQKHSGFDAVTGKSNFDISEWMLVHLLEWMQEKDVVLAMLCKTAVARKSLVHAWKSGIGLRTASLFLIDAADHFGAAVDACFLVCRSAKSRASHDCQVFKGLSRSTPANLFGFRDEQIVANVSEYESWKSLQGTEHYQWRSGIKHDCSAVMELKRVAGGYSNALGESIELEPDYLYPMLKSSDLANGTVDATDRVMLVPQKTIGGDTDLIENQAPKTWAYLQRHARLLDRRGSSIYKNRPRFSVFGIGEYSFAPWKVAISGLYKSLHFRVVGPIAGRPTVMDDTGNFIPCETREEAVLFAELLNSPAAKGFYSAFVFWDSKRPVTVELLRKLDLLKLASILGRAEEATSYIQRLSPKKKKTSPFSSEVQPSLFPISLEKD